MTKEIIVDEKKEKARKKENSQQEIQQKVMTYRILQSHLEHIRKEGELIERRYIETEATRQLIDDLKKEKTEMEILLPIGNGLFIKGKITDKKMMIVEVGAGVLFRKGIKDAELVVNQSKAEIEEAVKKLNNEMQETIRKLNDLTSELQVLQQGQ